MRHFVGEVFVSVGILRFSEEYGYKQKQGVASKERQ